MRKQRGVVQRATSPNGETATARCLASCGDTRKIYSAHFQTKQNVKVGVVVVAPRCCAPSLLCLHPNARRVDRHTDQCLWTQKEKQ